MYYGFLSPTALQFVVRDSNDKLSSLPAEYDFSDDRFHHVACVRHLATSDLQLFVDGIMITNLALAGGATGPVQDIFISDGDDPLLIGAFPDIKERTGFFTGEIDDFRNGISYEHALQEGCIDSPTADCGGAK